MGKVLGKFLIGSYNYNLNIETSNKDYKIIEIPDFNDLFLSKKLNRELDDHNSVMDYRGFISLLFKANPNAIELLFSKEQDYKNEDFKTLIQLLKRDYNFIIRCNWENFTSAMKGIAIQSLKKNDSKGISRAFYLYLLWDRFYKNCGTMTDEEYHNPNLLYCCRDIRMDERVYGEALKHLDLFESSFDSNSKKLCPTLHDKEVVESLFNACQDFFKHYLTSM